jgi:L-glyceraldehyde reductase
LKQSGPNEVKEAVAAALKVGYRHIDAAAVYGNEAEVGEGIKASGVDRKSIFVSILDHELKRRGSYF